MSRLAVRGRGHGVLGSLGCGLMPLWSGTVTAPGREWDEKARLQVAAWGRAVPAERLLGKLMDSGDRRRLSSLPSHCPVEFLHCHILVRSELRGPMAE